MQTVKTDVLVIGGGGAATRAALEARLAGAEVLIVSKGTFGAVGTRGAGATSGAISPFGIMATPGWKGTFSGGEKALSHMIAANPDDAFFNIRQVGLGMADPRLARILIEDAIDTRTRLLGWGTSFGEYGIRSHGVPIVEALIGQIRAARIPVRERMMVISLLVKDGECAGAVAVDEPTGDVIAIDAGAVVIGSGGDAGLFMLNMNPSCNTGDGYAMGYEAGAELMNLEFKQVFMASLYPTLNMLTAVLPPHIRLTNSLGAEFLQGYLPDGASVEECLAQRQLHLPFSTRDPLSRFVDIAIMGEVRAGRGTPRKGVYYDRRDSRNPRFPFERNEFWLYRGINFSQDVIEAGVCHHSSLGGFRIDENGETTVPRLYAAGEAAAGPHGVDRIGGHMLLASQVFGARSGRHAAKRTGRSVGIDESMLRLTDDRVLRLRTGKGRQTPSELKDKLRESAYYNLLVIRSEKTLNRFLSDVIGLRQETASLAVTNTEQLIEALELQSLLILGEVEARVCLERTESRGSHYREDFLAQDDRNWVKSIVVRKAGDGPGLRTIVLDPGWENRGDEKLKHWA
jgi:succinate dehydrogenase/fumarate reductase flavoprotein subunit